MKRAALSYVTRPDGAVLAVWNRRYKCWGLPGGKVDEGETLEAAQMRELQEETHLVTLAAEPIYEMATYSGSGRVCTVFAVRAVGMAYSTEVGTGVAWMTPEELCDAPVTGPWWREFFAHLEGQKCPAKQIP